MNSSNEGEKIGVRRRIANAHIDPDNYIYIPAKKQIDYYDNDVKQRVAIYARVSTDSSRQTMSFELQKKYYEDFVTRHPCWTLVKIYADEGISGTSLNHRDAFNEMIEDCKQGKIDMIITKSVSRFARNIMICIGMVQKLASLNPPVGIFFESECIFSLNDDSSMALSFQATIAQEESHTRSRAMESSLRMRFDHGLPSTPDRIGYRKNAETGKLEIFEPEFDTVKLAYFMVLLGYSTEEIAEIYNNQKRKTRRGRTSWTKETITVMLRSERNCGDVLTRKTFTPNYLTHQSIKNRGERPQSKYLNWHPAIVSRDDFVAVQRMLDNEKYGNQSILPKLKVINDGMLKGYVIVNPRWAAFSAEDYIAASDSAYTEDELQSSTQDEPTCPAESDVPVAPGDFDMSGFQVTRGEFLNVRDAPTILFNQGKIKFSISCINKFKKIQYIELLVHPRKKKFAIRPTTEENRNAIEWAKVFECVYTPKVIIATAFYPSLIDLMGWSPTLKYKIMGVLYRNDGDLAYVFPASETEAYVKPSTLSDSDSGITPLCSTKAHVQAVPQKWTHNFGYSYYERQKLYRHPSLQSKEDWLLRIEGELFESSKDLKITPYEDLQEYVTTELNKTFTEEDNNEQLTIETEQSEPEPNAEPESDAE